MVDLSSLAGGVVIVTGAGGGIGAAVAAAFSRAGSRVVVADLDASAGQEVADRLVDQGGEAKAVATDVTSAAHVTRLIDATVERFGRLDIVVNNAGVIHLDPLLELSLETWRRVFAVNVEGALLMTQSAGSLMVTQDLHARLRRRGQIINISSPAAEIGRPFLAAYGASKAALNHLSKSTALALGERQVASTVVYPPTVRSGMWTDVASRLAAAEGKSVMELDAGREFHEADDVAEHVVHVAAKPGMAMNGHTVSGQSVPAVSTS